VVSPARALVKFRKKRADTFIAIFGVNTDSGGSAVVLAVDLIITLSSGVDGGDGGVDGVHGVVVGVHGDVACIVTGVVVALFVVVVIVVVGVVVDVVVDAEEVAAILFSIFVVGEVVVELLGVSGVGAAAEFIVQTIAVIVVFLVFSVLG
jgi:hypothetical protein